MSHFATRGPAEQIESPSTTVGIIGGGVSGITTATLLQAHGIPTVVYAREWANADFRASPASPLFATPHAAASVIPHTVRSAAAADLTRTSQAFFEALASEHASGVRVQSHYEIFETPTVQAPQYAHAVRNFQFLDTTYPAELLPLKRRAAPRTSGWRFDTYFCENSAYVMFLYRLYTQLGGRTVTPTPPFDSLSTYLDLPHQYLVNAAGFHAYSLLRAAAAEGIRDCSAEPYSAEPLVDPWPPKLFRGHYLTLRLKDQLPKDYRQYPSYNYTPTADIYRTISGKPADVYCYPRSDTWLLGGSRQAYVGLISPGDPWPGEETAGAVEPFKTTEGRVISVPRPIFELNRELISILTASAVDLFQLQHDHPELIQAGLGYRYERSHPTESMRLARSVVTCHGNVKHVFHNYGHGGAGFTLSWGCALEVFKMLIEVAPALRRQTTPASALGQAAPDIPIRRTLQLITRALAT